MLPLHPPDEFDEIELSDSDGDNDEIAQEYDRERKGSENEDKGGLLSLRIKCSSLKEDVELHVRDTLDVATFKRKVKHLLNVSQDRYVRLICKGRLLAPDSGIISDYSIGHGDVVHAVLAADGVRGGQQAALAHSRVAHGRYCNDDRGSSSSSNEQSSSPLFYARTVLGRSSGTSGSSRGGRTSMVIGPGGRVIRVPGGYVDGDDDESVSGDDPDWSSDEENGRRRRQRREERRGFDRLRATSGLSRAEITAIRSYFSRHVERYVTQNPNRHADESDLRRRRELYEEDWMSVQGPMSEFRFNLNQTSLLRFSPGVDGGITGAGGGAIGPGPTLVAGLADGTPNGLPFRSANTSNSVVVGTDRDFMWGFMLGFFVGFVMLVWVWMPTVPHKQKLGILTGICFQLALNVLQQDREEDDLSTATLDHADLVAGGLATSGAATNYGTIVQDSYR